MKSWKSKERNDAKLIAHFTNDFHSSILFTDQKIFMVKETYNK